MGDELKKVEGKAEDIKPDAVTDKKKSGIVTALIIGIGIGGGGTVLTEQQIDAAADKVADSLLVVDSIKNVTMDSINAANVAPAKFVSARQKIEKAYTLEVAAVKNSTGKIIEPAKTVEVAARVVIPSDKYNPQHYYQEGEKVLVRSYDVTDKDTVLNYEGVFEAGESSLFCLKPSMNPSKP